MKKVESFISIVIIFDDTHPFNLSFIEQLSELLNKRFSDFEFVFIDNQKIPTPKCKITEALTEIDFIRYLRLTHQVQDEVALAAGLENAIGDYAIAWSPNTDPQTLIFDLYNLASRGNDVVIGVSKHSTDIIYRSLRYLISGLLSRIGYTLPFNSTGTLCLSRQAINTITETGRYYCKLNMRIANTGFDIKPLEYTQTKRSTKRIKDGFKDSIHHIIFNSTKPLRWMSTIGITGCLLAFVFASYSLIVNILLDQVTEGWTTTVLFFSILFGMQFIMLAIFGEYVGRLLNDRSEHKDYGIKEELTSSVMVNEHRTNVLGVTILDSPTRKITKHDD